MTSSQLSWQDLQPNITGYASVFSRITEEETDSLATVQPRLLNALACLDQQSEGFPLLLVCSQENLDYLALIARQMERIADESTELFGGHYHIIADNVTLQPPGDASHPFTGSGQVQFAEWIENDQLFGCVRLHRDRLQLEPGLIHRANGGTLVLSLRTLQAQPLLWLRLKRAIQLGRLEWQSPDERHPLPVSVPPLPLSLKLVLCGDRDALAAFQESDPELHEMAIYTEFEENMQIVDEDDMLAWCRWAQEVALQAGLPAPQADFWPPLIREAVRYTGDQEVLPLCPRWLLRQMREAFAQENALNEAALVSALD
ncbi:AAA family ATPase, partial [Pantoea septica]|uniref:AAA family ATPase n=1 Tax=Pantoea septica TaxID=472695 RepID=UPI003C6DF8F8